MTEVALKCGWVGAMLAVLLWWLRVPIFALDSGADPATVGEDNMLAMIVLVLLTFPVGFIWALLINLLGYVFYAAGLAPFVPDWLLGTCIWLGFLAAGYLQWFRVVPLLARRVYQSWVRRTGR